MQGLEEEVVVVDGKERRWTTGADVKARDRRRLREEPATDAAEQCK